jgi:hypothetical protein
LSSQRLLYWRQNIAVLTLVVFSGTGGVVVTKRNARFCLVLTPLERSALEQIAEADGGLSYAAAIRRLIRQAARERGLWSGAAAPGQRGETGGHRREGLADASR